MSVNDIADTNFNKIPWSDTRRVTWRRAAANDAGDGVLGRPLSTHDRITTPLSNSFSIISVINIFVINVNKLKRIYFLAISIEYM